MTLPLSPNATWPIPDWDLISNDEPDRGKSEFWAQAGDRWMSLLAEYMGAPYQVTESPNFWLIAPYPAKQAIEQIKWLEASLRKIARLLGPLAEEQLLGKCPVLMFADDPSYYSYISNYYDEGEWATSGGVYVNSGYGHFAIPESSKFSLHAALAHELTHALIKNQAMPAWVNEGLTQLCEEAVAGRLSIDMEEIRDHIDDFWNEDSIQTFWNGSGFKEPDVGQALCYHLSQLLVYRLIKDRSRFDNFASQAHFSDAGEKALVQNYGVTLHELASHTLGEGNWSLKRNIETAD